MNRGVSQFMGTVVEFLLRDDQVTANDPPREIPLRSRGCVYPGHSRPADYSSSFIYPPPLKRGSQPDSCARECRQALS